MNWRAVKEVIDLASPAALRSMIAVAGFRQSGESVYVKAAILLREKERIDEALMLIASVLKRRTDLMPSTAAGLRHLQAESPRAICRHDYIAKTEEHYQAATARNSRREAKTVAPKTNPLSHRREGDDFNKPQVGPSF